MYAASASFLEALRGPHEAYAYVEAWRDGVQLEVPESTGEVTITRLHGFGSQPFGTSPFGGELVLTEAPGVLPLHDGVVQVDGATPGVRRTLSASFAPVAGLWDVLSPIGTELKAFTVLRFPDGVTETIQQGVFVIDVQNMGVGADGDIKVTAPDRWLRVLNGRFLAPRASVKNATAVSQITTLIEEVMPAGVGVTNLSTSTAIVPKQTWDRDRAKAIQDMATAASLDVFMSRDGTPTIRDAPTLSETPVWDINEGDEGILISADRERNRQRTYNIVVVNSSANPPKFATQYVWDNNSASPTYAGPGGPSATPPAASSAGGFGQRPFFYSSPLLADVTQARAAGATLLEKVTGFAAQVTCTAASNPALEDGDTIRVVLPRPRRDLSRPIERHIVDTLTIPLAPHRSAQRIGTRSTVADIEES